MKATKVIIVVIAGLGFSLTPAQAQISNQSNAQQSTSSDSTGVGLSENTNANVLNPITGISQDFSSDGNNIDNSQEAATTYVAPDVLPPDANQYSLSFIGQNSGLRLDVTCPAGGGFSLNLGSYLGGIGLSLPSSDMPEDCRPLVENLNQLMAIETGTLAANVLGGDWKRVFFEQLLMQKMNELGLTRNNVDARIKLDGLDKPSDTVTIDDLD